MTSISRLAAILADMAGYSLLMVRSEEGTHERAFHCELSATPRSPSIMAGSSRPSGDGLLAKVPSVVDAVHCAAEMKPAVSERNAEVPTERRIVTLSGSSLLLAAMPAHALTAMFEGGSCRR